MWNSYQGAWKPFSLFLISFCFLAVPVNLSGQASNSRSQMREDDLTKRMTSFRRLVLREESEGRTFEKWVIEAPSINGGEELLYQVEQETVQTGPRTSRSVRRVFGSDADGGLRLLREVVEERRTDPGGGQHVVRNLTQPDTNGRSKPVRREIEETTAEGGGIFRTRIDIFLPDVNQREFSLKERIDVRERREGDKVLEADRTHYSRSGRDQWRPIERSITSSQQHGDELQSQVQIYRPEGNRELFLNEQIVSRQWTDHLGQEQSRRETYSVDHPGRARSKDLRLLQRVTEVRSKPSQGGEVRTVRQTEEWRLDRMRVVERVVEVSRPDGKGGFLTEREVQKLDLNGRLATVSRRRLNRFPFR